MSNRSARRWRSITGHDTRFVGTFIGSPAMNFFDSTSRARAASFVLLDGIRVAIDPALGRDNAGKQPCAVGHPSGALPPRYGWNGKQCARRPSISWRSLARGAIVHVEIDGHESSLSPCDEAPASSRPAASVGLQLAMPSTFTCSLWDTGLRLDDAPALKRSTINTTVAA